MEPKQLRIGNLLKDKESGKTHQVKSIEYGSFKCKVLGMSPFPELNQTEVEPIPLTEEWLDKLSYRKEAFRLEITSQGNWAVEMCWGVEIFGKELEEGQDEWRVIQIITYVHEWQNLYFMLTDDELI